MSLDFAIAGIGWWSPGVPDWAQARALIARGGPWPDASIRPAPSLLSANERRRAPETVLLALAAAEQAMAGTGSGNLASVFASSFGDLGINDYLCATLASAPEQLSPTRFHNSVHNAPSGYWGIATGSHRATTSISAHPWTFGAALLEAATQVHDHAEPVLLVAYDIPARGPLLDMIACREPFALALLLTPDDDGNPATRITLGLRAGEATVDVTTARPELAALAQANPIAAGALPLLPLLATGDTRPCSLPAGASFHLHLDAHPR